MPPADGKKCKMCRGKGWIGRRGLGARRGDGCKRGDQGWIRVPCICGALDSIGVPPLSAAILRAHANTQPFESADVPRATTTVPAPPERKSA